MKRFKVNLYFEGSLIINVDANDEREALDKAMEISLEMSDEEFLKELEPQYAGNDVYEL